MIIKAKIEDAAAISSLHGRCFKKSWDKKNIEATLKSPGCIAFIISHKSEHAGFIIIRIAADECEIISMGTIPESQNQGLAKILLEHAIIEAKNQGVKKIYLEVAVDNEPAKNIYSTAGFIINGKRKGYYKENGEAKDAITMSKEI